METNSKDFGAVKNSITGKTIREMSWEEIFSLVGKPMTQTEMAKHVNKVRQAHQKQRLS